MADITQRELAEAIGVSDRTIHTFERGTDVNRPTRMAIRYHLESCGVSFVEQADAAGVLLSEAH